MANVFNVSLDYLVGKEKTIALNTNGLNTSQIESLQLIIDEYREQNKATGKLTERQMKILNLLLVSFFH